MGQYLSVAARASIRIGKCNYSLQEGAHRACFVGALVALSEQHQLRLRINVVCSITKAERTIGRDARHFFCAAFILSACD